MKHQHELYIARVQAGSRQDELLDYNRAGYAGVRPWHESPTPVFDGGDAAVAMPVRRARQRRAADGWMDRLAIAARKEKADAIVCVLLIAAILVIGAVWGQKMHQSDRINDEIERIKISTEYLEGRNGELQKALDAAKGDARIRNLAQNELGMLRPERAETRTIYVQASDLAKKTTVQENEEPKFEALDFMLGLLNVFGFEE
ncbi:MAG: hypothetical protein J6K32_06770 [Clostridia bacterium]|nr:hypothetical protein [Clostridia bacterium]